MDENTAKLTMYYLDKISNKIGATSAEIWPWLVKREIIEGIFSLIIFLLISIGTFFICKYVNKNFNDFIDDDKEFYVSGVIVLIIINIVSGIISIVNIIDMFTPEYAALMNLIDQLK